MLITSDFVFVHIPKTGGSFINQVVAEIYGANQYPLLNKALYKLNYGKYCVHFSSNEVISNLNGYLYGQHCGLRHIPQLNRPIIHVKRNPESYYRSLFQYAWFKKIAHLENEILKKEFTRFPNLLPDELFKYYQLLTNKIVGSSNLRFGYLTYQIVDQLSPSIQIRDNIFNLVQAGKLDEAVAMLKNSNPRMSVLNLDNLNVELEIYLKKYSSIPHKKLKSIQYQKKFNASEASVGAAQCFINEEQKSAELFAYKYWGYSN